jgi:hypothetical protein
MQITWELEPPRRRQIRSAKVVSCFLQESPRDRGEDGSPDDRKSSIFETVIRRRPARSKNLAITRVETSRRKPEFPALVFRPLVDHLFVQKSRSIRAEFTVTCFGSASHISRLRSAGKLSNSVTLFGVLGPPWTHQVQSVAEKSAGAF